MVLIDLNQITENSTNARVYLSGIDSGNKLIVNYLNGTVNSLIKDIKNDLDNLSQKILYEMYNIEINAHTASYGQNPDGSDSGSGYIAASTTITALDITGKGELKDILLISSFDNIQLSGIIDNLSTPYEPFNSALNINNIVGVGIELTGKKLLKYDTTNNIYVMEIRLSDLGKIRFQTEAKINIVNPDTSQHGAYVDIIYNTLSSIGFNFKSLYNSEIKTIELHNEIAKLLKLNFEDINIIRKRIYKKNKPIDDFTIRIHKDISEENKGMLKEFISNKTGIKTDRIKELI